MPYRIPVPFSLKPNPSKYDTSVYLGIYLTAHQYRPQQRLNLPQRLLQAFLRKQDVRLPSNINLKTGIFLAIDHQLAAVFAVKYMPAENVDWALHALHHSRITPVLAVRDGNITPALLKRKFGTDARAVYPKLSTRLALSERGGGRPYALLMREGLMPYAEVVLGSKRLCASARRCTVLAFLAATASTLLAFYLTFVGAYSVLTPFSLLIYVLLWSLSALVDALLSDRY